MENQRRRFPTDDQLENYTVHQLKTELRKHGLGLSGTKTILVKRLRQHYQTLSSQANTVGRTGGSMECITQTDVLNRSIHWTVDRLTIECIAKEAQDEHSCLEIESDVIEANGDRWYASMDFNFEEAPDQPKGISIFLVNKDVDQVRARASFYILENRSSLMDVNGGYNQVSSGEWHSKHWREGWGPKLGESLREVESYYSKDTGSIAFRIDLQILTERHHTTRAMCPAEISSMSQNSPQLSTVFGQMFDEQIHTDCTLQCQDDAGETQEILCHKCVLASHSPVFKAMFNHEFKESLDGEIHIHDYSYATMKAFVRFLYTYAIPDSNDTTIEMLRVSEKYGVEALTVTCMKKLAQNLTTKTACTLLTTATQYSHLPQAPALTKMARQFIAKNLSDVMATEGWSQLVKDQPKLMAEILSEMAKTSSAGGQRAGQKRKCPDQTGTGSPKRPRWHP